MSPSRAVRTPLGAGPSAEELVRRAADWEGLVCLRGAWAGGTAILTSHPLRVLAADADPLAALDDQPPMAGDEPDIVGGGWFGALAYDGTSGLAFHDHLVRQRAGEWYFEALWREERAAELAQRREAWRAVLAAPPDEAGPAWTIGEFDSPSAARHLSAVEHAVELIRAGELYQVNVCTRLSAPFEGSPAALFADVAAALRPARGAFVAAAHGALVGLSPELFLRRRGRAVTTAPIKGTLPRVAGDNNERALRASAKDAAENVMIVDLMRNDLGRVCEPGTVRAPRLLDVEAHPGVWHLVSTVEGRLRPDVGDAELLRATFPPGSVTGAPKVRAMAAIAELEPVARSAYTGAVGFASPSWGSEFAVTIRTFEVADGRIALGVGGGVTADSVPMLEWRECLHKAAPLLRAAGAPLAARLRTPELPAHPDQLAGGLIETVLAVDGRPLRLADHLARLDRSTHELFGRGMILDGVARAAVAGRPGRSALRIVVAPDLSVTITAAAVGPPPAPDDAVTVRRPPGLWRHKWADRATLRSADAAAAPATPLFVAADGVVLETSRGNVFLIERDGTLVTPPLRDDVLPGITRRAVLDLARDAGRPTAVREFDVAQLRAAAAFWTSSLSGAVPIRSVDGFELPRADDLVARLSAALFAWR